MASKQVDLRTISTRTVRLLRDGNLTRKRLDGLFANFPGDKLPDQARSDVYQNAWGYGLISTWRMANAEVFRLLLNRMSFEQALVLFFDSRRGSLISESDWYMLALHQEGWRVLDRNKNMIPRLAAGGFDMEAYGKLEEAGLGGPHDGESKTIKAAFRNAVNVGKWVSTVQQAVRITFYPSDEKTEWNRQEFHKAVHKNDLPVDGIRIRTALDKTPGSIVVWGPDDPTGVNWFSTQTRNLSRTILGLEPEDAYAKWGKWWVPGLRRKLAEVMWVTGQLKLVPATPPTGRAGLRSELDRVIGALIGTETASTGDYRPVDTSHAPGKPDLENWTFLDLELYDLAELMVANRNSNRARREERVRRWLARQAEIG